jgi:hypothetical protein
MNYAELTTALAKSFSNLSDNDLRSLNNLVVSELNDRIRQKRDAVRAQLKVGNRVTIEDPRCHGKFYIIERFTAKSAVLRQDTGSAEDFPFKAPRIRATTTLLKLA